MTIGEKGCALTALSMALDFAGFSNTPGSLNQFMINTDRDYVGSSVWFWPTVRTFSNLSLKFRSVTTSNAFDLGNLICQTQSPVVVGVNLNGEGVPGHFVLATGVQDGKILIADPGYADRTTLDAYQNMFQTRGYVTDPPGQRGELDMAVDNQRLLVTDPSGKRTGFETVSHQKLQEIPQSAYFVDALKNDVTGAPPTTTAAFVNIFQPVDGTYQIAVVGASPGAYELSVNGFAEDGSGQPAVSLPGITDGVTASSFQVQYRAAPGVAVVLSRVVTFRSARQDVAVALTLGLIDSPGIAIALSQKLEAAENAAARGNTQASTNTLNAFQSLVEAQRSKHIREPAATVLLDDAARLSASF